MGRLQEEEESRRQAAEQQRSVTHEHVAALQQKTQDTKATIDAIEQQVRCLRRGTAETQLPRYNVGWL
jgi:hypothetical protein